jgi:membrane-associated phospholipid phosphatase
MSPRHTNYRSRLAGLAGAALLLIAMPNGRAQAGDGVETSGDVLRAAIPAAAFVLTFTKDDRDGRSQFYKSFGATVGATLLLKELVDKDRPDGSDNDAFPSGHASTAFQGASFIHRRYGFGTAWPAWVLAAYTGWTRLDADEHDEADVLAGAALGIASSFLFVDRYEHLEVAFTGGDGFGIRFSGRF